MKNKKFLALIPTSLLLVLSGTLFLPNKAVIKVHSATLPTTIDLNDSTPEEIKAYYAGLSGKSESELSGTNLLKNLKGIIGSAHIDYFSYSQSAQIYVITDRDWKNSPANTLSGTYDAVSNTVTGFSHSSEVSANPYIHMLYCDYTVKDKTLYKGDGDVSTTTKSFDNEHAWSQTHGFADKDNKDKTGAGSDLHHLIAGTQYGNRTLHNNYSYGFVKESNVEPSVFIDKPYEAKNDRGTPLNAHAADQQAKVFEPQDADKGDIARALLYMVACYNNYDGSTPTQADPALKLVDYVISENTTGFSSNDLSNGYYGILSDILAWHKMDPVDEYEIHRNNLIYKNYQHNRNPFIDYPQWVDYIWGTSIYDPDNKTVTYNPESTGSVNLEVDVINGYKSEKAATSIAVTHLPNKVEYTVGDKLDRKGLVVTATFDDESTADVTANCTLTVDMKSAGEKTVTVKYQSCTTSFSITVKAKKSSSPLGCGGSIIGASVLLSLTAGLTLVFFLVRRKFVK